MNRTTTRPRRLLAATALAAAGALAAPAAAQAAPSVDCSVSTVSRGISVTCKDAGTTGTQFAARVGCAVWAGGYEVYSRYGAWARQGSGTSTARCDVGHYVVKHGVTVR